MNRYGFNSGFEKPKVPLPQDEMFVVGTRLKITDEGIHYNVGNIPWHSRMPELLIVVRQKTANFYIVMVPDNQSYLEMKVETLRKYYEPY